VTHDFDDFDDFDTSYSILHCISSSCPIFSTIMSLAGKFVSPNEIECTDSKGAVQKLTARQFIVAVGGRPTPLECPGAELSISSDDLFMMVLHFGHPMPYLHISFTAAASCLTAPVLLPQHDVLITLSL
jgi:hypothetical protein